MTKPEHYWQEPACCATCLYLKYIQLTTHCTAHVCDIKHETVNPHTEPCKQYKPKYTND